MPLLLDNPELGGQKTIPEPMTISYKSTPENHSLLLDLYLPNTASASSNVANAGQDNAQPDGPTIPTVVYFHGGGLMYGSRNHIPREFLSDVLEAGWAFVSASHRFLFPCTAHDISNDVKVLFDFLASATAGINTEMPAGLPFSLSRTKFFVAGYSAGAYLARLACLMTPANNRPRPLAAFFLAGQGGHWLSPHYICPKAMSPKTRLDRYKKWLYFDDRATQLAGRRQRIREKLVVQSDLGNLRFHEQLSPQDTMRDLQETNERMGMATVLYQIGRKLDYLTGHEGLSTLLLEKYFTPRMVDVASLEDPTMSLPVELHYLFPEIILRNPEIAAKHPPVIFIHGTGDRTVLPIESQLTARQLVDAGVEVDLILVQGWGHGYSPNVWQRWGHERVIPFFKRAMHESA
ncbi:Alpha/Beta hydrolase protein [Peziza echinospora]|nr:Alpha/Beta hydrolase protein [Peziza echinospora]